MNLFRSIRSYRSLVVVALGTLAITGCQTGTPLTLVEPAPVASSSLEVYPGPGVIGVVGDDLPATIEYPTYYLYILDRDGVPVQRFECDGQRVASNGTGRHCTHPDGTFTMVSEAVPSLLTPERLLLKGEQPAPEQ